MMQKNSNKHLKEPYPQQLSDFQQYLLVQPPELNSTEQKQNRLIEACRSHHKPQQQVFFHRCHQSSEASCMQRLNLYLSLLCIP